jgi:hypothetical protein
VKWTAAHIITATAADDVLPSTAPSIVMILHHNSLPKRQSFYYYLHFPDKESENPKS